MKIIQPKNTKAIIIAMSVIAILLAATLTSAYYFKIGPFAHNSNDSINFDKPTTEQIDAGKQTKEQTIDQVKNSSGTGSDPAVAPQPIKGSDKKTVNMEITAANQNDSALQVRTLIQAVVNTGECTLTMEGPQGATYTAKVGVQALASSSTCRGFDIPLDQLSMGVWTITANFTNDELTTSATKEIEIK